MPACPEKTELTKFVEGELHGEAREIVARHLQQCPACAQEADQLRSLIAKLRAMGDPPALDTLNPRLHGALRAELARERRALRWQPMVYAAAAAVLVLTVGAHALLANPQLFSPRSMAPMMDAAPPLSGSGDQPESTLQAQGLEAPAPEAQASADENAMTPGANESEEVNTRNSAATLKSVWISPEPTGTPSGTQAPAKETGAMDSAVINTQNSAAYSGDQVIYHYVVDDMQQTASQISDIALLNQADEIRLQRTGDGWLIWITLPADQTQTAALLQQLCALPGLTDDISAVKSDIQTICIQIQGK